jgi:FkbM family methyltransferase
MLTEFAVACARQLPAGFGQWRLERMLAGQPARTATVRTADRFRIRVDTRDLIQRSIYFTGRWEDEIASHVRHLGPGDLFVDVGANVGYFSLLAASRGADVIAFEPDPECCVQLDANALINGYAIDARRLAISDEKGESTLYLAPAENRGGSSLKTGKGPSLPVPTDTLDAQLDGRKPTLVKIDVEGAEVRVLRGARALLSSNAPPDIICEVSEFSLKELGSSKDELFALMAEHGFACKIISPIRRSVASTGCIYFQYDVLFSRALGAVRRSEALRRQAAADRSYGAHR